MFTNNPNQSAQVTLQSENTNATSQDYPERLKEETEPRLDLSEQPGFGCGDWQSSQRRSTEHPRRPEVSGFAGDKRLYFPREAGEGLSRGVAD